MTGTLVHALPESRCAAGPMLRHRTLPPVDITRRELLKGTAVLLVAAGCRSPDDRAAAPSTMAATRTIEHKYGGTEIAGTPERVVTVGLTDHDTVLALGVTPLGVYDWYGEYSYATHPWAQHELGDARPAIVGSGGELDFEAIAAAAAGDRRRLRPERGSRDRRCPGAARVPAARRGPAGGVPRVRPSRRNR